MFADVTATSTSTRTSDEGVYTMPTEFGILEHVPSSMSIERRTKPDRGTCKYSYAYTKDVTPVGGQMFPINSPSSDMHMYLALTKSSEVDVNAHVYSDLVKQTEAGPEGEPAVLEMDNAGYLVVEREFGDGVQTHKM